MTPEREWDPAGPAPGSWRRALDFLRRVYTKAMEDNIFFMAGAITFNLIIVVVPLVLLMLGIAGFALRAGFEDPSSVVLPILLEMLPAIGGEVDLVNQVRATIDSLVAERTGLSVAGALIFIWITTRLVGTLRTALGEIFDVTEARGIVEGKLFDAMIVVLGSVLVLVNLGITALLESAAVVGGGRLGLEGPGFEILSRIVGIALSVASIWVLFLLVYRFLPVRRIPWRTAVVAATFMAVIHELMKTGFSWYVASIANFRSAFGNLTVLAVLFIWIYYESVVFILGGEVAQIYNMNRVRRLRLREIAGDERR